MIRYVNYDVLEKSAIDFKNYSNELQEINNSLKTILANVESNWKSSNTQKFETLFNETVNDMQVDINKMQRFSNVILGINDKFQSKDLEYANKLNTDTETEDYYGKL